MDAPPSHPQPSPTPDDRLQPVREVVRAHPDRMTLQVAREFGVPERDVLRCLPPERVKELNGANWEQLLRSLEGVGPVRVLVTNDAATIEVVGRFGGFSTLGGYFNVQTPTLDMHIRAEAIDSVFAVEKPSHMDRQPTHSLQFFDVNGKAAFKVFLTFGGPLTPEASRLWSSLR